MSFANEIWLAIRTDVADGTASTAPGSAPAGSPGNPWAANTPESFANLMREQVPANSLVRLGPGVFRTRGVPGNGFEEGAVPLSKIWRPKSGQKIIGSGTFSTTLQENGSNYSIAHNHLQMNRTFQLYCVLFSLGLFALAHAADETMSARIDAIQKASNGVYISFTVTGVPDFVDVEGSPTLAGVYREEQLF
jgi:hypothetical protein